MLLYVGMGTAGVSPPTWLVWPAVAIGLAALAALAKFFEWRGSVNTQLGTVKDFMAEIRDDIKGILKRLPAHPRSVESGSPVRLTEFGQEIAATFKAKEWATEIAPSLEEKIKGNADFEVDQFSHDYVHETLEDLTLKAEARNRVGAVAYQFGVERPVVLVVLQVVLRDELLRRRAAARSTD